MLTLQTLETIQKRVKLSTGVELPYVEQGDPAGVPVLLLHGYTDSWHSFEPVLPYLPSSIHAIALTQRGHGEADRPATGYHFQDFAADLAAFMDTLKLRPAVIAGTSMGSSIAQRFVLDYPGRTLGLVLMGSATTWRNPVVWELGDVISTLTDPIDPSFVREFQKSCLAQPVPQAFFDTIVQESLKVPAWVWKAALEAHLEADYLNELGKIKVPTLILWGDQDAIHPRSEQEALLAAVAGAQLIVYSGAGHALHWEEPARFAADLVTFIKNFIN
ncbi:MAG: alpha/beta hydrolase [Anaerolineales bacterium]|nr:alpha/beta hydrolase [Anaerolineales bacterium]